ncbi:MAG: DUF1080 domain-containing protein, partial [Planctomycetaceae bacterium]|nr:DUF1080 domain-containing protein [Planctomycetaceae bacterium]
IGSSSGGMRLSGQRGPRAMLTGVQIDDFELQVEIKPEGNAQAGVVFRVADSKVGIDACRGYYVGLHAGAHRVMWGVSKPGWLALADGNRTIQDAKWYHLRLRVVGDNVKCFVNEMQIDIPVVEASLPVFDGVDQVYGEGGIGFRVLGTAAEFRNLTIRNVVEINGVDAASPRSKRSQFYINPVQAGCADPVV